MRIPRWTTMSMGALAALFLNRAVWAADSNPQERRVVVIVWDGMRPDFVRPETSPVLWKLAKDGVVFRNHHSVFTSATNVNGVAIATGLYPNRTGIFANFVYRPDIDKTKPIDVAVPASVRRGDEVTGGKYIPVPTLAELVRAAGKRVAIAGAKDIALLQDRHLEDLRSGTNLFSGNTVPSEALAEIVDGLGKFPDPSLSHTKADLWTTNAFVDFLWKNDVPAFSLLWLSEPDWSEHNFGPGSKEALAGVKSSDENLGRVLAALNQHHARDSTDVLIVSDHGFSTIERSVDLRKTLQDAGFDAATAFDGEPKRGQIVLSGNGGTVLFYVSGHDADVTRRLVGFLQQSDFAGVLFTKEKLEGTFTLEQGKIDSARAPDVAMVFRWNDSKNQFGVPGMIDADWNRRAGQGTHATLSRFDMHNTLIAVGPDFHRGTNDLPTGNVDLAPTILQILDIKPPQQLDGRVLIEAIATTGKQKPEIKTIEATREFPSGTWRQHLQTSQIGSTIYFDEGNGGFSAKK